VEGRVGGGRPCITKEDWIENLGQEHRSTTAKMKRYALTAEMDRTRLPRYLKMEKEFKEEE
jgi:hypothetical protein